MKQSLIEVGPGHFLQKFTKPILGFIKIAGNCKMNACVVVDL